MPDRSEAQTVSAITDAPRQRKRKQAPTTRSEPVYCRLPARYFQGSLLGLTIGHSRLSAEPPQIFPPGVNLACPSAKTAFMPCPLCRPTQVVPPWFAQYK